MKADLERLGHVVCIFLESDVMKTPKLVFDRLRDIINENKVD